MSVLVIRHGFSKANDRNNVGGLAFAAERAPLMPLGREQTRASGNRLRTDYGIATGRTSAATSYLLRAQQSARQAGFRKTLLTPYTQLDEVKHGIPLGELRAMLDADILPTVAMDAAHETLNNLPAETVWFSHGLRIAGLCALLGVYQDARLIPRFGEIRELPL